MTTFYLQPRWAEINGKMELLDKITDVKLKSLNNEHGKGYTWHIIWRDGKMSNTLYSSKGKDCFRKKDLCLKFITN